MIQVTIPAMRFIPVALVFALGTFSTSARAEFACTTCHEDVMAKEFVHEPAVMDCFTCHAEHQGDPSVSRVKDVTALCMSCHEEQVLRLGGGHPVQNHPYWIQHDPMWEDDDPRKKAPEFNCLNCHSPHSSDMPKLFRWNYMKQPHNGLLCSTCHADKAYGGYVPPKPVYDSPRLPPRPGQEVAPPKDEGPKKKRRWWEYIFSYDPSMGRRRR